VSATPAIHFLRQHGVDFTEHEYRYEERGGTAVSARELGVDEHVVIKTLVMEDERKQPLIVLMHGDREVSTKNLARQIAVRHAQGDAGVPRADDCRSRSHLHQRRPPGFLIALAPADLIRVLSPTLVDVSM